MKRLFTMSAFVVATALFFASCGGNEAAKTDEAAAPAATEETAAPAEEAAPAEAAPAEEAAEATAEEATETSANLENGKAVYDKACGVCHNAGVAGAAKLDDKARWEATAAKGLETVDANAINGYTGEHGSMPAKGGQAALSDDDVKDAVAYMLHTAGVEAK
jgi:cytochrome c5